VPVPLVIVYVVPLFVHDPEELYTGELVALVELDTVNEARYAALAGAPVNVVVGDPRLPVVVWLIVAPL